VNPAVAERTLLPDWRGWLIEAIRIGQAG